jgi:hypothetical protein
MNYGEMSDFEVNKEVAKVTDGDWHHCDGDLWKDDLHGFPRVFDPCNNPSDAWPIIVDNEITLFRDVSTNDVWGALGRAWFTFNGLESKIGDNCEVIDKNPLRAAMICFLKMNDAESD